MTPFQLGEDSLEKFIKSLYKLLIVDQNSFDFIVAAGNSGQIMVWISRVMFKNLHLPFPPSVVFPIYRYKDFPRKKLFDNSAVINQFSSLQVPQNVKNVLFVDDEIDRGNSVKSAIKIFENLSSDHQKFNYTIIAEDGGTEFEFKKKSNIKYISPKIRAEGIYSAISYLIPLELSAPIKMVLETKMKTVNNKKIMCILLGLPIKEPNNGTPQFTFKFEKMVKEERPHLIELQKEYQAYLERKIAKILGTQI